MPTSYVCDAHTLVWYIGDNRRLGANARAVMSDPVSQMYLPIIALAEACHVVARGRTTIPSVQDLLRDVDADPRIVVLPLDREMLELSLSLVSITEMHDRLIAAVTLWLIRQDETAFLLTCDANITDSGLVPVIW